ncbi:MAG TPA: DNA mismatch repair protein MutS [bacterium]|nr:DNA mismatch repair protein MutS [bacterium]
MTQPHETPMMSQYMSIKKDHPDAILLFRMGDFYETFFDDASTAAKVLGIALTSRSREGEKRIPLAGVPYHAVDTYVARLVRAGYKVAICDQVENPKDAKGLVKRRVVEVITPGTITSALLLDEKENNYLLAIVGEKTSWGIAKADLSTGEFTVTEVAPSDMVAELAKARPSELLYPKDSMPEAILARIRQALPATALTGLEDWLFLHESASATLCDHFRVANLQGFGCQDLPLGVGAAGALVSYLRQTQKRLLPHISRLAVQRNVLYMEIDEASFSNLEIMAPLHADDKDASLLGVLDKTLTSMGGRCLRRWLRAPLVSVAAIRGRLEAVDDLVGDDVRRRDLRSTIRHVADLERLVGRVCCERAGPRDLLAIRESLIHLPEIKRIVTDSNAAKLSQAATALPDLKDVETLIGMAIQEEAPAVFKEGEVIREGFDGRLDQMRGTSHDARKWILDLQAAERERTGIPSLKVGYNKVFGYYIEVSKSNLKSVPQDYLRKQTLVGGERFVTEALKQKEAEILEAEENSARLEEDFFKEVRLKVAEATGRLQEAAGMIAEIDVLAAFAEVARAGNYARPILVEERRVEIREGRHPVVECFLGADQFVPNDVVLDEHNQILVITGPNMAGKSTFIRQVALIVVMAQIGSFVPAASATIGIVDKIFTRIGATDRVARGQSTFLVEMMETANILNNATSRSLVLLDEVGRGTSTYDGLSIAWAVVEYLHNNGRSSPLALFATHYHELTDLAGILPGVKNFNVQVKEYGDRIVFLRKIVEGGSDRSYGIQVARLAGLPQEVVDRAREILANLEEDEYSVGNIPRLARGEHSPIPGDIQLTLWETEKELARRLAELDLDNLTPLEALKEIAALKKLASKSEDTSDAQD